MIYNNKELDLTKDKFFVNTQTNAISFFKDLKLNPINEKIYYGPSFFPHIDTTDINKGSVFVDHVMPTEAYTYTETEVAVPTPSVSLNKYNDVLFNLIKQNIIKIYNNHDTVILSYSGGIDSMVLLSFIVNLGFLNKTVLTTHKNKVTNAKISDAQIDAVNEVFNMAKVAGADVLHTEVTEQDLLQIVNTLDFTHVKAYTTSVLLSKYKNAAFMFGHHGNQALLHKDIFIDQILLKSPTSKTSLVNKLSGDYYVRSIKPYNVDKQLVSINDYSLCVRRWPELDGFNNNKIYSPLGVNLNLCRYIDFGDVEFDVVLDAHVARYMIERNVGNKFDKFILVEGLTDGDVYATIDFNANDIASEVLVIPKELNHNKNGVEWLRSCLEKNVIEHNTLISIKMLQYLAQILKI